MQALEQAIQAAIAAEGSNQEANKAYLEFIKANFIIPVDKDSPEDEPVVLYLTEGEDCFLPVFSQTEWLDLWAKEIRDNIKLLKLSGVDLLKGIGDKVTVCLNIGSPYYKEFNPSEIARMRSMILKIFK